MARWTTPTQRPPARDVRATKAVVLGGGSLNTPAILLRTPGGFPNDHVGRHLRLHPVTPCASRFVRSSASTANTPKSPNDVSRTNSWNATRVATPDARDVAFDRSMRAHDVKKYDARDARVRVDGYTDTHRARAITPPYQPPFSQRWHWLLRLLRPCWIVAPTDRLPVTGVG